MLLWHPDHIEKAELHSIKIKAQNTCTGARPPSSDVLPTSLGATHDIAASACREGHHFGVRVVAKKRKYDQSRKRDVSLAGCHLSR